MQKSLEEDYYPSVESGLEFILNHFQAVRFPRMISTAATDRRQYEVDSKERAMLYYRAALWEDCRISAFGIGQTNPNLIFIDLDESSFPSFRALKLALSSTLKNIEKEIGGHPSVLWSGHGFHVIQPIDCAVALEQIKDLAELEPKYTSNKFLQFAERYLSAGKSDKAHSPATRSCMLRIPYSLNSECKAEGIDSEVKIIQKWDGHRPDYRLLTGSFHADLLGKREESFVRRRACSNNNTIVGQAAGGTIEWIDKLLHTGVEDNRKGLLFWVLAPYLITVKGLDHDKAYTILEEWLDKCDQIRRLEPGRTSFRYRIRYCLEAAEEQERRPIRFDTFKEYYYPDVYKQLYRSGGA